MTNQFDGNDDQMSLRNLRAFVKRIDALPEDLRGAVDIMFHNPTDAAVPVFEAFDNADRMETLQDILDDAQLLHLKNAEDLDTRLMAWTHRFDNVDTCEHGYAQGCRGCDPDGGRS